jgi:hypothetical protein
MQTRVPPAVRERAGQVADALGISLNVYVETLLLRDFDALDSATGLPAWAPPLSISKESPLPLTA